MSVCVYTYIILIYYIYIFYYLNARRALAQEGIHGDSREKKNHILNE